MSEERKLKYAKGDRVVLTFSEARGERGIVVDVGVTDGGAGYEYADILMDATGERTGKMPITCMMHDGAPPSVESPEYQMAEALVPVIGILNMAGIGMGTVAFALRDLHNKGLTIRDLPESNPLHQLSSQIQTCADSLEDAAKLLRALAREVRPVH